MGTCFVCGEPATMTQIVADKPQVYCGVHGNTLYYDFKEVENANLRSRAQEADGRLASLADTINQELRESGEFSRQAEFGQDLRPFVLLLVDANRARSREAAAGWAAARELLERAKDAPAYDLAEGDEGWWDAFNQDLALFLSRPLPAQVERIRAMEKVVEAAGPLAWGEDWGTWLAQMPVPVAKAIVGMRKRLQDALAVLPDAIEQRIGGKA